MVFGVQMVMQVCQVPLAIEVLKVQLVNQENPDPLVLKALTDPSVLPAKTVCPVSLVPKVIKVPEVLTDSTACPVPQVTMVDPVLLASVKLKSAAQVLKVYRATTVKLVLQAFQAE
jgi:hypothetical protein